MTDSYDPTDVYTSSVEKQLITWQFDSIEVIAEHTQNGLWDVSTKEDGILVGDIEQNVPSDRLLYIVNRKREEYHSPT